MNGSRLFAIAGTGLGVFLALSWSASASDDRSALAAEEAAIRKASAAYGEARKQGNGEAVAALWTAKGVYIDADGRARNAHELINKQLNQETVDHLPSRGKLESISTIRFITPDVALEEGAVSSADGRDAESIGGRFTAVWVKKDRRWLLDSVREWPSPPASPGDRLDALAWMIGDWSGRGDGLRVKASANWSENGKFILWRFTLQRDGGETFTGTQRIGWDPSAGAIRSWAFDSDGGIVEGRWRREGDSWIVKTTGVLPNGSRSSSVSFWVPEGDHRCVLKSSHVLAGDARVEDSIVEFTRKHASRYDDRAENRRGE